MAGNEHQVQPRMPAEEGLQIRLAAFEQPAHLEGEYRGQHQKDHDEDIGQRRREIAAQFAAENHHYLVQIAAPSVAAGRDAAALGARLGQCAKHLVEPSRLEMQLGNVPIEFRDQRAHRGQGIGARARHRGDPQVAFVGLHRRHFGEGPEFSRCGRELLRFLEAQADGMMVARARLERARCFVGHDATMSDDDGARAHLVHFFQDVGRDDDQLVLAQFVDQAPHLVLLVRVQAVGGFVQDESLRVVDQRLSQADAPPEALGQGIDHLIDDRFQGEPFDDHAAPLPPPRAAQPANVRDEIEKFGHGHFTVAGCAFGEVAHAGFRRHRSRFDVVPAHRDPAGGGRDEAGDHAHGGGFPGTVGAQEAQHFARPHRERQVVHGELVPIPLG